MTSPNGPLGFFTVGAPIIFIRSSVLADADPHGWQPTRRHFGSTDTLSARTTILHEIRHFHDALASPYFFCKFLIDLNVTNYFYGAFVSDRQEDPSASKVDPALAPVVASQYAALEAQFPDYLKKADVNGDLSIDVYDILETTALATEMYSACLTGDAQAAGHHRSHLRQTREPRHFRLYDAVLGTGDVDLNALAAFGHVLTVIISTSADPAQTLAKLIVEQGGDPAVLGALRGTFNDDDVANVWGGNWLPQPMRLMQASGERLDFGIVDLQNYVDARRQIFDHYVGSNASFSTYVERMLDLPLPPTCFYANEAMIEARDFPYTSKKMLKATYSDVMTVHHLRNRDYKACITTGLINTLNVRPFVSLERVHLTLFFRYLFQQKIGRPQAFVPHLDLAFDQFIRHTNFTETRNESRTS